MGLGIKTASDDNSALADIRAKMKGWAENDANSTGFEDP